MAIAASETTREDERVPAVALRVFALALLGLSVVLVYAQVVEHSFLSFDDDFYVAENAYVRAGLHPGSIVWALVDVRMAHYWHPLTWMSHMLDVELFGLAPGRHLVVNVALHLVSTYALWAALFLATRRFWESLTVAALFALQPQAVEAVAWIAERKGVLSTTFWCVGLALYVSYARRPSAVRYLGVFLAFVCAAMSKPTVVTFPAALLLLDYWPLRRARFAPPAESQPFPRVATSRLLIEKLPLLIVSLLVAAVTLWASGGGTTFVEEGLPLSVTVPNALRSYVSYLVRSVAPLGLAAFYPHPGAPGGWSTLGYASVLVLATGLALAQARARPHLLVGWLWYLGTLLPMIQILQNARHGMADRYVYIPLIGIFVAVVWEIAGGVRRGRIRPAVVSAAAGAVLVFYAGVSWVQVSYWRDTETLFRRALAVTEENYIAHASLGAALLETGRLAAAEDHLREALRIRPAEPNSMTNLGLLLAGRGRTREAIALLRESARLRPQREAPWFGLGMIYEDQGRLAAAAYHYRRALRANRLAVETHFRLGVVLERRGAIEEARRRHRRVLALDPGHAGAQAALARLAEETPSP